MRYVRVTTGVLRYHSSRDCGMVRPGSWAPLAVQLDAHDRGYDGCRLRVILMRCKISLLRSVVAQFHALLVKSMSNRAKGAVAPLALPATAPSSVLGSWLENDAVDALPYADTLPAGWRESADALVRDELRRSEATVEDYVAKLPQVPALSFKARRGRTLCVSHSPSLSLTLCLRCVSHATCPGVSSDRGGLRTSHQWRAAPAAGHEPLPVRPSHGECS